MTEPLGNFLDRLDADEGFLLQIRFGLLERRLVEWRAKDRQHSRWPELETRVRVLQEFCELRYAWRMQAEQDRARSDG